MTREELEEALEEINPNFFLDKDKHGHIIIITGLIENQDGELVDASDDDDFYDEDEDDDDIEI